MSLDILLKGQLSYLNKFYEVIAVSGQDKFLENVKKREKVNTESVAMYRSISPIKDFISLVKLFLLFKKQKPLIVHSITPKAGLLSMIASYFAGVPIRIHTFTGLTFPTRTGVLKKVLILMDKILCFFATAIYPEGEGVKQDLIKYKITNKSLNVIANGNVNGIDLDYYNENNFSNDQKKSLKNNLKISSFDFVFIFVGRLVSDKGINELIVAFERLQNEKSNIKLLLVGDFESALDPLLPKSIKSIESNKDIVAVGFQKDVRPFFAISNALVFPSYREGFPNVVLQAGAMGLPSIVSNINGCNEIIKQNQNGLIVSSKNEKELHDAMLKFIDDEKIYNYMLENARPMIVSRYCQKIVWSALLSEYQKLEENV
jgi:glycosyltransferase involved in cell wall biosynthesis